jgi:hypothetical protein
MAQLLDTKIYGDLEVSETLKVGAVSIEDTGSGVANVDGDLSIKGKYKIGYNSTSGCLEITYVG